MRPVAIKEELLDQWLHFDLQQRKQLGLGGARITGGEGRDDMQLNPRLIKVRGASAAICNSHQQEGFRYQISNRARWRVFVDLAVGSCNFLVSLFISAEVKTVVSGAFHTWFCRAKPRTRRRVCRLFHFNRLNLCWFVGCSIDAHFNIQEMDRETHTDKDRRHSLLLLSIHSSPVLEDEI